MSKQAIPTIYAGIKMRSRLEARWAAFFDLLGWPWVYEPIDLNGYIPDFALRFPADPLLVEVKPAIRLADLWSYASRIPHLDEPMEIMVVGATPLADHEYGVGEGFGLGIISQKYHSWGAHDREEATPDRNWWGQAGIGQCLRCKDAGVYSFELGWYCYRCGEEGKACYQGHMPDFGDVRRRWAWASNTTQWKSPRRSLEPPRIAVPRIDVPR